MFKRSILIKSSALTFFALAFLNVSANAQYYLPFTNINKLQTEEQMRIDAGVRNGSITAREAARLQARLNNLNSAEARLRSTGGRLSFGERQSLVSRLGNLSNDIYRQSHDRDGRCYYAYPYGQFPFYRDHYDNGLHKGWYKPKRNARVAERDINRLIRRIDRVF